MNPQPLAIYDARKVSYHKWPHWREAEEWLHNQGIIGFLPEEPRSGTYRVEIWLIDTPFARCFRYALDDRGRMYADPERDDVAVRDPEDLLLRELPPEHLRWVAS